MNSSIETANNNSTPYDTYLVNGIPIKKGSFEENRIRYGVRLTYIINRYVKTISYPEQNKDSAALTLGIGLAYLEKIRFSIVNDLTGVGLTLKEATSLIRMPSPNRPNAITNQLLNKA